MAQSYDPYNNDRYGMGDFAKDAITAPFNPATYATMYRTMPGMWSIGKGLWLPGVGKALERGGIPEVAASAKRFGGRLLDNFTSVGANGARVFRPNKIIGGTLKSAKNIWGSAYAGGGHFGGKAMEQAAHAKSIYSTAYETTMKRMVGTGVKRKLAKDAAEITATRALEKAVRGTTRHGTSPIYGSLGSVSLPKDALEGVKGAKHIGFKMGTRGAMKAGLAVGKAASMVGMAMFAWDMISMVGVPLGRAAVSALDSTLTEFNDRFTPETGGRLSMSYLTQGAATERQRAINAISKSQINGRSAFGQEAKYMHQ